MSDLTDEIKALWSNAYSLSPVAARPSPATGTTAAVYAGPLMIDDIALPSEVHDVAGHLIAKLRGKRLPRPTGWHILVLQYVRDDTMKSSSRPNAITLITPETMKREDQYQGRCGVVLAVGPEAYADKTKFVGGPWCRVGDWVSWRNMESAASRMTYADVVIARLADDTIMDVGIDPTLVS